MASSPLMKAVMTSSFIFRLQAAGMRTLNEGAKISYELATERGKTVAGSLKVVE